MRKSPKSPGVKVCVELDDRLVKSIQVIANCKARTFRAVVEESLQQTVAENPSFIPEALRVHATISN